MKQGIVKFSKEFVDPNTGLKEWYGYEGPVDELMEADKIQQAFKNAKEQVIAAKGYPNLLNPDLQYAPGPSTELPVINKAEERLGILIENARTTEELMNYKNDCSTVYLADLWATKLSQLHK